jgi:hypothetical protein
MNNWFDKELEKFDIDLSEGLIDEAEYNELCRDLRNELIETRSYIKRTVETYHSDF